MIFYVHFTILYIYILLFILIPINIVRRRIVYTGANKQFIRVLPCLSVNRVIWPAIDYQR